MDNKDFLGDTELKEFFKNSLNDDLANIIVKQGLEYANLPYLWGLMDRNLKQWSESDSGPSITDAVISDRFNLYKNIWGGVLEYLYQRFLPDYKYNFSWVIEVSPYTLMCTMENNNEDFETEFEKIEKYLKIEKSNIESNFYSYIKKISLNKYLELIPENILPDNKVDCIKLIFKLMDFPPLEELSEFFIKYTQKINNEFSILKPFFRAELDNKIFNANSVLMFVYHNIDANTFSKHKLEGIKEKLNKPEYDNFFNEIESKANEISKQISPDKIICSCCGNLQDFYLPEEALQLKLILENRKISNEISLLYLDEYIKSYKNIILKNVVKMLDLNNVNNPSCLILVEGESEEKSLPVFFIKKGIIIANKNIKIYNCKSKQKVLSSFLDFKEKYPQMKIICLLDSDAVKEARDIARLVKENKDKYHLIHIGKGCFEDLFDINTSVEILNSMYPEGDKISIADFDEAKDFGSNVSKVLHEKKNAKFDKVKFANLISNSVKSENIPKEIEEIISTADNFTIVNKYIEKS